MIQLGTDPNCIIFAKQYNWGLSPIVLYFYSALNNAVER